MTVASPMRNDEGVLERFLEQVVVDEYADQPPSAGRGRHWLALPVLVLIGVLLAIAVITTNASDDQRQQTRAALVTRVSALTASVTERQARVDAASARVEALRQQVLSTGSVDSARIDRLAEQGGATALAGPGLTVTVDDAPQARAGSLNRVLDRDLQDIVNALWRAGAVGVSVNGERLTSATAIRNAGDAILVDFRPLTRPYRIAALAPGGATLDDRGVRSLLSTLSTDYGLVTDVTAGDVALRAGDVRDPRFATVPDGGAAQ